MEMLSPPPTTNVANRAVLRAMRNSDRKASRILGVTIIREDSSNYGSPSDDTQDGSFADRYIQMDEQAEEKAYLIPHVKDNLNSRPQKSLIQTSVTHYLHKERASSNSHASQSRVILGNVASARRRENDHEVFAMDFMDDSPRVTTTEDATENQSYDVLDYARSWSVVFPDNQTLDDSSPSTSSTHERVSYGGHNIIRRSRSSSDTRSVMSESDHSKCRLISVKDSVSGSRMLSWKKSMQILGSEAIGAIACATGRDWDELAIDALEISTRSSARVEKY